MYKRQGEEVREGSHFLSQEVLFCPVWPGLAHSCLDLGAQAASYVVYFFLVWPHCRRKAEVQALVWREGACVVRTCHAAFDQRGAEPCEERAQAWCAAVKVFREGYGEGCPDRRRN